jgi:hypothetical protein
LVSQALKTQNNLETLTIDFYFNNIVENGTKFICDEVSRMKTLKTLNLNFDFNYIKNEGGKYIGSMLSNLPQLT